jgi:glycosyltransferase involved in cell wall biosynthesis
MSVAVLYVHHRGEPSGAAIALARLIGELDRGRYEPHVYTPPGGAAAIFRAAGATVHLGPVASFTHVWASVYRGRRWLLAGRELALLVPHLVALRRLLRRERFALVHLNDSPLVPAALLVRRQGLPLVWHLRSALAPEGGRRSRLVRAAARRLPAAVIAINADVAASFGVPAEVVHDSVDLRALAPTDSPGEARKIGLRLPAGRPVVLYVGYLYPQKGFAEFIRSAASLRSRAVEATHVLVGGAVRGSAQLATVRGRSLRLLGLTRDYEREARELAGSLGVEDLVVLVPRVPDPAPFYAASDVVVHPSRGPEVGLPAIEAAAAGVPAVVTGSRDGGGVVLHEVTGLVAPGADEHELADAVASLLLDAERRRRLGAAARSHAETRFDAAANARRVEGVYDAVLAGAAAMRP